MNRISSTHVPDCDDSPNHARDRAILASRIRARIKEMKKCREMLFRLGREVEEMQRKHDSFAPISVCPPEILTMIFETYVVNHWTEYDSALTHIPPHKWLKILHVCRTWRALILSMPQLWTRITLTSPDFVQFAVLHSGNLPILFKAFRHPEWSMPLTVLPDGVEFWTFRGLNSLIPRLRHADVLLTLHAYQDIQTQISSMQHVVAAELEELRLICFVQCSAPPTVNLIVLPVVHLPKLATLRFTCIRTESGSILRTLLRSTLTTLALSANYPAMQPLVMVELLQQLPFLQTLHVNNFLLYEQTTYPFTVTRRADLAHLRNISLRELNTAGSPSIQLLYHLVVPNIEDLELHMVDHLTAAQREILLSALFQRLALHTGSAYPPLACAHIMDVDTWERQNVEQFRIRLRSYQRLPGSSTLQLDPGPKTSFTVTANSLFSNKFSPSFLTRLNKRDLIVLHVRDRLDQQGWRRAFADSINVQRVFIEDPETAYEFLAAFSEPIPEEMNPETQSDEPRPPKYLFPVLKELELFAVRWRKACGKAQSGDFLPHALMCLKLRMQQGMGLQLLKVTHAFNITPEEVNRLHDPETVTCIQANQKVKREGAICIYDRQYPKKML